MMPCSHTRMAAAIVSTLLIRTRIPVEATLAISSASMITCQRRPSGAYPAV
jgi:hypothetical protein